MFSLSRAMEILSQQLVLRTDILKKTVAECTCLKGKTPYCQNSMINVLKSVSLACIISRHPKTISNRLYFALHLPVSPFACIHSLL